MKRIVLAVFVAALLSGCSETTTVTREPDGVCREEYTMRTFGVTWFTNNRTLIECGSK